MAPEDDDMVARAIAACRMGVLPDKAAKVLDWREFEAFCASLLRSCGYSVAENVVLTKPRIQIDLVAKSPSVALVVDCKHRSATMGPSALARAAEAQLRRARQLREKTKGLEPIAVVILVLAEEQVRYTNGVAVVPLYTFSDFLTNIEVYSQQLTLC